MSNSPSGDNVIELSNGYFYWNSEGQTLEDQKKKKELEKEKKKLEKGKKGKKKSKKQSTNKEEK